MNETPIETTETTEAPRDPIAAALAAMEAIDPQEGTPEAPEPAEDEGAPEDGDEGSEPSESPKGAEKGPEEAGEDELVSPRLAMLARREKQLREEQARRAAEIESREKELEERLKAIEQFEAAKRQAQSDPAALFEALGISEGYKDIAAQLWAKELGEDAPAELKEQQRYRTLEARMNEQARRYEEAIKQQEQRLEQMKWERQAREYENGVSDFLGKLPEKYVHLGALVQEDRGGALHEVLQVATQLLERDSSHVPTPEELADVMEEHLERQLSRFKGLYERRENRGAAAEKRPAKKTLKNQTSTTTRPKKPALSEEERVARARAVLDQALDS